MKVAYQLKLVLFNYFASFHIDRFQINMSQNHYQLEVIQQANPRCDSCGFVLPSQTASTGLRCGLNYFKSNYIMRKFQLMQHFPEVHGYNACESWDIGLVPHELHGGFTFNAPRTGDFSTKSDA
jgi:hypothetical protein